jgi:hypothetical protein
MARIKTIRPIESISGKLKKSDNVGFALRKKTAKNFTVTRDDWSQHFLTSEKQAAALARQAKFRGVSQAAHARLQDPTKRQADELAFRNQTKYTTLFGYVFHQEWIVWED